jgi:hypothetical protein
MSPSADPSQINETSLKELARERANPKILRRLLEFLAVVAFAFFVLHECGHILAAYLIGFDMTGWYFYIDLPFLRWQIPAAPSTSAAPLQWFLVRLSGPLLEGSLYLILSLKKNYRHFLFMALFAFVYSYFESFMLLGSVFIVILLLFGLAMILCTYFWIERTIDQTELALIKSQFKPNHSTR